MESGKINYCAMSDLIGKNVTALFLSPDQATLIVTHDQGQSVYTTFADCCSETWIADIVGVQNLLGHTVVDARDIDVEAVDDGRSRQECDEFYGIKIVTTGGYVDLIYRNSSNGYYGGNLSRAVDYQIDPGDDWLDLRDDYSA
ncbi:MAG TPA: hypothetical protein V6C81_27270 [Planktothrix sp.]